MLLQIATLTCIALILGISTSVGIGGTTLINILLIIGFDYSVKESIGMTYIFLMGGGLAASVVGARKFTPKGKKLIDYDLVLITLPMMMSGSIFGVSTLSTQTILNHFASEALITLIFILLLFYMISYTWKQMSELTVESQASVQMSSLRSELIQAKADVSVQIRLQQLLEKENSLLPWDKLKIVLHIYVYTVILVLFRGGTYFESIIGLQACNIGSWICLLLHFLLSYLYCKSIAIQKFQMDAEKESLGFVFDDLREKMSYEKMREAMFNGFLGGTIGGFLAVSGGLVLIPLWLRTGINRNIVINSTAPLIFFGASISFLISLLLGFYDSLLFVLLFFTLGFIGSYHIKNFFNLLQEKYTIRTTPYIVLILIMTISLIFFLPVQYQKYLINSSKFLEFTTFC